MTSEDYKMLMRFHLLTTDININGCTYAVVDADGRLYAYAEEPDIGSSAVPPQWVALLNTNVFYYIYDMTVPEDWKETLIKL